MIKMYLAVVVIFFGVASGDCNAQDPTLPPSNLGLSNLMDGVSGPPGFIYVNYTQIYQTRQINGPTGSATGSDLKINSLASIHQLIWATPINVLGGKLGFMVLIPIVKISATSKSGAAPSVNPAIIGDIAQGTSIRWPKGKLFNKPLSQRIEFSVTFPTGSYSPDYVVNPSARLYTFSLYHTFTYELSQDLSVSFRNQYNINSRIIHSQAKPGGFYNGNYTVEYRISSNLKVELVAYYLQQVEADKYAGDRNYFLNTYGIKDTKEQTLALGGGLAYLGSGGKVIELKTFTELESKNRTRGIRPTLKLAFPITK